MTMPDLRPLMLCGLTWTQAKRAIGAVTCALRRPHWCSPVVIIQNGELVIDDDGDILPFSLMPGDRWAHDWMMVPRVDDDGNKVQPTYRIPLRAAAQGMPPRSGAMRRHSGPEGPASPVRKDAPKGHRPMTSSQKAG
jgi:hypothetical protein